MTYAAHDRPYRNVRVNPQFQPDFRIESTRVVIKGAGDLATGVALRLARCGFPVIMTELAHPLAVRRSVALAEAVYTGAHQVEELTARRALSGEVDGLLAQGIIPVIVEPDGATLRALRPAVVVDAIMAKHNTGTTADDAPLVVALGPGFVAGADCHAVIETNRGHNLGRALWQGAAEANTGIPGEVSGAGPRAHRVLRAPAAGFVEPAAAIGDEVAEGALIAWVRTEPSLLHEVRAPFAGTLRGIIHPSVCVSEGMKIGDLDARARRAYCFTVSDKALAIGGGALEAILQVRPRLP